MKTLKQIREASGGKEAYQKFFNSLLKKYNDIMIELTKIQVMLENHFNEQE